MRLEEVMEGSEAVALAVKACRPQVISAFPISPQTHIVERLARMVSDGDLHAEYVRVESEFSAASVVSGASLAGSRAYTASSSQGLLLMSEVLYASAGMRLPFVMTGVNRTVSAPISIQVDHQDTVSLRDCGVIQMYVESCQEAYDAHLVAFKVAEDPRVLLPTMVCMDGWILTHSYERVSFLAQQDVDLFLPPFKPVNYLDVDNPQSWGSYADEDVLMEFKYSVQQAMVRAKGVIKEAWEGLARLTGRDYGGLVEGYRTQDADLILVAMGSMAGTAKEAVDKARRAGDKLGLARIRCYRPFPHEELWEILKAAEVVAVMDANFSMGSEGALALDLKAKLYGRPGAPVVIPFVAGLGGREVGIETVLEMVHRARECVKKADLPLEANWMGLNEALLPD